MLLATRSWEFLTSQRLPCACAECWKRGHTPNERSSLSEQHLADCGKRSDARNSGGSQLHDGRVLEASGEVLLRMD